MAETIYDDLLRTGQEILRQSGYLNTEEQREQAKVEAQFAAQRNKIVYDLLANNDDGQTAKAIVTNDFVGIRADTNEYLIPIVDHVENELIERIDREAGKSPLHRRVVKWTPVAIGMAALAAYFGVALFDRLAIDQPIESRVGIEQRAAALKKAMRYEEWTNTTRNRLWVDLLLWPISPNETENKGATEFAELVLGGRAALRDAKAICNAPTGNAPVGDADIVLAGIVADYVRDGRAKWTTPPVYTLLPPIRTAYRCS